MRREDDRLPLISESKPFFSSQSSRRWYLAKRLAEILHPLWCFSYCRQESKQTTPITPSPWQLSKELTIEMLYRLLCFDYSFELLALNLIMPKVKDETGDSTRYQAASALIIYFLNFAVAFTFYPLIPFGAIGSGYMKEIMFSTQPEQAHLKIANIRKFSRLVRTSLIIGALPAALSSLFLFYAEPICLLLKQDREVSRLVSQFTKPTLALMPILMMRFLCDLMMMLGGKSHILSKVTLACWILSGCGLATLLTLDYSFLPRLGIPGAFLGFAGQIAGSWLILNSFIKLSPDFENYQFLRNIFQRSRDDNEQLCTFLPMAVAYELTISSELMSQFMTTIIVGGLGSNQLAAQDIWTQIAFFSLIFNHGLGMLAQQKVGMVVGERWDNVDNIAKAQRIVKYTLGLATAYSMPIYILVSVYPRLMTDLIYNVNDEVRAYAENLIPLACLTSLVTTIQFIMIETLKQGKNYWPSVLMSNLGLWAGVGISYFLSEYTELDVYGVAYGALAGAGLSLAGVFPEFFRLYLKEPQVILDRPTPTNPGIGDGTTASLLPISSSDGDRPTPVSSNNYGCFGCFSRLYNRLFGKKSDQEISTLGPGFARL
jgi:Na+-driven multidrug efflux pump